MILNEFLCGFKNLLGAGDCLLRNASCNAADSLGNGLRAL